MSAFQEDAFQNDAFQTGVVAAALRLITAKLGGAARIAAKLRGGS